MKLTREFIGDGGTHNFADESLNKWIKKNDKKYDWKIEGITTGTYVDPQPFYNDIILISYWPKNESHTVWYVWNQNCIKKHQSPIVFMSHSHKRARHEADNLNLLTTSEASIYHVSRNLLIR